MSIFLEWLIFYRSAENLIENSVEMTLKGVIAEVQNINETAEDMASYIICRALLENKPGKITQTQMEDGLAEIQDARTRLKKEHLARIHHTIVPINEYLGLKSRTKTRDEMFKQLLSVNKDAFDSEAVKIDPKTECITKIGSKLLIDLEAEYWSSFEIRFTG